MEVFISNVPENATEKLLKRCLAQALHGLSIHVYHCKKLRGRNATLTIGDVTKARVFLEKYGEQDENNAPVRANAFVGRDNATSLIQAQYPAASQQLGGSAHNQPRKPLVPTTNNKSHSCRGSQPKQRLMIMGRAAYFRKSRNDPDEFLLRSLEEEASRSVQHVRTQSTVHAAQIQRKFAIHSLSCGSLESGNFITYFERVRQGFAHFGNRFLKVNMETPMMESHQIEFDYDSMLSLYVDKPAVGNASLIIVMVVAPRLYEQPRGESLEEQLMRLLTMTTNTKRTFSRNRVDSLGGDWNGVGATCFVYRIHFSDPADLRRVLALKKDRHIPDMDFWCVPSLQPRLHYAVGMEYFTTALSHEELPFPIKFQLQLLVSNGELPPLKVVENLFKPTKKLLARVGIWQTVQVLQRLPRSLPFAGPGTQSSEYDIETLVKSLFDAEESDEMIMDWTSPPNGDTLHPHQALIHKALVTPQGVYLAGPFEESQNRVLRRFAHFRDFFMRVEFAEETGDPVRYDPKSNLDKLYRGRFKKILEDGIIVGGRKFEFLGYSHSSLRSQSCWFMAPFTCEDGHLTARTIIPLLGDFSGITSPAKYAARLGQVFSDTLTSIAVPESIVRVVDDVERNQRVFSDGVGTISASVMDKILKEYALRAVVKPTVFQIRFAGAKGMLSYDRRLEGDKLMLRRSMIKFVVEQPWAIEVCGAGIRPLAMHLNRPLIKIMEDLGVPAESFIELQQNEVEEMRLCAKSPLLTANFLESANIAQSTRLPSLLRVLGDLDIPYSSDDFLRQAIELAILVKLRELKYRARIRVEEGATVYGIMDETGYLNEGEVFVPIQTERSGRSVLVGDGILITRSPAMHPGDVQLVNAVDVPEDSPLNQLHNCVVFSQKGDRDLPSKLSGGDLDGDLYNVIWDPRLSRPKRTFTPADYPRVPELSLGRPVATSDCVDHFLTFMQQDQLGRIATIHLQIADQSDAGALDEKCLILAELHSCAVDFSKTGIPVDIRKIPKYKLYRPDFMAPGPRVHVYENLATLERDGEFEDDDDDDDDEGHRIRYYKSHKVLGRLFRGIDEIGFLEMLEKEMRPADPKTPSCLLTLWQYVEHETALLIWDNHKAVAKDIKELYEDNLLDIMHQFSVTARKTALTEAEVFVGQIVGKSGDTKRQREASMDMREKYDQLVQEIVSQILNYAGGGKDALERSIACFAVAAEAQKADAAENAGPGGRVPQKLHSFGLIAASICVQEVMKIRRLPKNLRSLLAMGAQG